MIGYSLPPNYDSRFNPPDEYDWAPGLGGYERDDEPTDEDLEAE